MTSDLHWVFAYGSNMHLPDLKRWLGAQGCSKTGIHQITPAILEGFELVWNYWSPVRQGGAANVQPASCQRSVFGALLQVDTPTLLALDTKEGHPERYSRDPEPLRCHPLDKSPPVDAWVYQVTAAYRSTTPVPPSLSYLTLLIEGAEELKLPGTYIDTLRTTPIAPTSPSC
jgi:hypothetical protein